jgi:hypothetical protein
MCVKEQKNKITKEQKNKKTKRRAKRTKDPGLTTRKQEKKKSYHSKRLK